MATPTPTNPTPNPSSASRKGPVTTPSNRNIASPAAPRSVPSPAATRKDASGKTPVNHPTVGSSHGSKTLGGGTPMVRTISQNGTSPGGQLLGAGTTGSLGTPSGGWAFHGLGLTGVDMGTGTPTGNTGGVSTPGMLAAAAAGMVPSLSSMSEILGGGVGGRRNEEEERRVKMRRILKKIGRGKGRVSEEGISRVAKRVGMDVGVDDDTGVPGGKVVVLAGHGEKVAVEVKIREGVVRDVGIEVVSGEEKFKECHASAAKVLKADLRTGEGDGRSPELDKFSINLDRLARMDRLSKDSANCFEAIAGLYSCLKRLHTLEKEAAKAEAKGEEGKLEDRVDRIVACEKSGKPSLHENGRIGLSLDYWSATVPASTEVKAEDEDGDAMDVDSKQDRTQEQPSTGDSDETWSLRIEAEHAPTAAMYSQSCLRVSDAWLPETFDVSSDAGPSIPWQDPPPTFIGASSSASANAMVLDDQKLPDLRFVAKLDPPLMLPLQTAQNVLNSVGLSVAPMTMYPIYHLKLLGVSSQDITRPVRSEQDVLVMDEDGKERMATHHCTLDVPQLGNMSTLGYKLQELPFSHPRQLVELLPTLRQWAFVSCLLRKAFPDGSTVGEVEQATSGLNGAHLANGHPKADDLLDSLLADDSKKTRPSLSLDISLSNLPQPTLEIVYADADGNGIRNVVVQVLQNAEVVVSEPGAVMKTEGDTKESEKGNQGVKERERLAKALRVCADLSVWVEWLRRRKQE